MKIVIIIFSPSGNTERVGQLINEGLKLKRLETQYINLSEGTDYFKVKDKEKYLKTIIRAHDLLLIGSPVYAHHLHYNIKDLISFLPKPGNGHANIAVPFVTYGGIASGIALEEAGKLLNKSGRMIFLGAKFAMSHKMTRVFMDNEFDVSDSKEINSTVKEILDKIGDFDFNNIDDSSKALSYQSRLTYLKANIIFNEKKWHNERYPEIKINQSNCIDCGVCIKKCPVHNLVKHSNGRIDHRKVGDCIHCFNCIISCPSKAIYPEGDLDKAREFMEKMKNKEREVPASKVYM